MKKLKILVLLFCLFVPCFFAACSNSNKNVMSTPIGLEVETGGKITFERVNNEDYYVIEVNNLIINIFPKSNSNVELFSLDGKDYLVYDASKILTLGESYSIKVKACGNEKKDSNFTETVSYTHTLPVGRPESVQINNMTLTWDPVENASFYRVKVVTPTDKISVDDSDSIANIDIPAYQFSVNKFDFASILTHVGEYKFYVSAVSFDKNYTESGYTSKIIYKHKLTLDTPTSVAVHKVNELDTTSGEYVDNLHMIAVLDSNANVVTITNGSISKKVELGTPNDNIILDNNLIDINLSGLFNERFDALAQYNFTIQANYITANEAEKFYIDSIVSSNVEYTNYAKISKPIVEVIYDNLNETNIASWRMSDTQSDMNNIAGFVLYLHKSNGISIETMGTDVTNRIIGDDVLAISVQALGKGNYISSSLSDTVSQFDLENTTHIEFSVSGGIITWTDISNQYLIEIDSKVLTLDEANLDLTTIGLTLGEKELKVIVVEDGYIPYIATYKFIYNIRLSTPTNCTFSSSNPYLLTFVGVNNAIGYSVYLNDEKIDKIFTATAIDLSKYVIKEGEYKNYSVQVQSVADKFSGYKDSALSTKLSISHTKVLDRPEFKKDADGDDAPIEKKVEGGNTSYFLYFYGVDYAVAYEIMINFNKITIVSDNRAGLYEVDVTDYMSSANSYTITVRALPNTEANIKPSEKNSFDYVLRLQLNQVTEIKWAENEGIYTLSFDTQDNAKEYRIHIVKINDSGYDDYLHDLGLTNLFTTPGAADITAYLREAGLYQIYVTAIADSSGGYYADSDESSEYAEINKLTTLNIPDEIQFNDKSQTEYLVRWTGDSNADYYVLRVTDPKGIIKEYQTTSNNTTYNINDSYTVEGQYTVKIKSMIKANSDNASAYQSSSYCDEVYNTYNYNKSYDFKRYSVFMYGNNYDFYIENINDLMYILWNHLLYGVEPNGLKLYLALGEGETVTDAIIRLAEEATELGIYAFDDTDEGWTNAIPGGQSEMFKYIATKLLGLYPELAIVNNVTCTHLLNSEIFTLSYANVLEIEKVDADSNYTYFTLDYGNKYTYLADSARRKETTPFTIDSAEYVDVTTTEQLLMAVQYGKRPNFIGNSEVAEEVYANAKSVLLAIANNTMSDYEKVTAIFDWIEYAVNLNYYSNRITASSGMVQGNLSDYGIRKDYYLEGIFLDLNNLTAGGYDNEFYLGKVRGTSESYAKAFTLLCAIEGIETRKVNGVYSYVYGSEYIEIDHTWNKVYLDLTENDDINNPAWYALDLLHSDNKYVYHEAILRYGAEALETGYGMSSHAYFLVKDDYLKRYDKTLDKYLGNIEDSVHATIEANTLFDYYTNATFSMTNEELHTTLATSQETDKYGFIYKKKYVQTTSLNPNDENYDNGTDDGKVGEYQGYAYTINAGYGELYTFLVNAMIYANNQVNNINDDHLATFEVKIDKDNTNGVKLVLSEFTNIMNAINQPMFPNYTNRTSIVDLIAIDDADGNVTYICTMKLAFQTA